VSAETATQLHHNHNPDFGVDQIAVERLGLMDYQVALELQRELHQKVVDKAAINTLLLLEHPPVFTAGRRTLDNELPQNGSIVIPVDRGGKITFHGPGQIVGYPIIRLKNPNDVVGFVRVIETALIAVCQEFGLDAQGYCERSGVWLRDSNGDRKIAAIGIRVARGVTMHGFALNVDPDLTYFQQIIPCGIADAEVTSLSKELNRIVEVSEVYALLETHISEALLKVSQT
jgi:lipoyl(octanoyl) transferase